MTSGDNNFNYFSQNQLTKLTVQGGPKKRIPSFILG